MKHIDVVSTTDTDFGVENNNKDLKWKIGDHVRILLYIFSKLAWRRLYE